MQKNISEIQINFRKLANNKKAKILSGFFKTGKGEYGYGDIFLGIMVPDIRNFAKKNSKINLNEVKFILRSKYHEERLLALFLLVNKFQKENDDERRKIFEIYFKNIKYINNWDLVDQSADKIVGKYLENKDKKIIEELAESENVWEKRIAMISCFAYIKDGKADFSLKIAEKLIFDKNDLIQKAVGWMLRAIGKKCAISIEENFLNEYAGVMPRTTLRYAIERFSFEDRKYYMDMKNIA